jgi:hypothetical protein
MAHMQLTARIGEHGQAIKLFFGGVFTDLKGFVVSPKLLDIPLYFGGIVMLFVGHEDSLLSEVTLLAVNYRGSGASLTAVRLALIAYSD